MTAETRQKWVQALRSGDYTQISGLLWYPKVNNVEVVGGGFCCLGVFMKVCLGFTPDSRHYFKELGSSLKEGEYSGWRQVLEKEGLPRYQILQLVEMNDNGVSFSKIADWIESNVMVTQDGTP